MIEKGIVEEILSSRGINSSEREGFLNPDLDNLPSPSLIPNIRELKEKIENHIFWESKIFIYGDYDVDGVSSSAVLYKALESMGANIEILISNRFLDGYGLSKRAVNEMKDADLIITLDNGISNSEEIEYAKSLGIEVIVIDHHIANIPPDCLYVDLKVENNNYPYTELCGAGITWRVAQYITGKNLYNLLDIVAFATVADVVPLREDNRIITKFGIDKLNNNPSLGLKELIRVVGLVDKEITGGHIGFMLAPCVNAQGRLDSNQISVELLTTEDPNRAEKIANEIYKVNKKRQKITKECYENALEKVNEKDNIIIIQGEYPAGLVGLVAGNLKEKFDKPVIVLGNKNDKGICKGSCRSLEPLHIKDLLDDNKEHLEGYGGHKMAAGLSIHSDNIEDFKQGCLEYVEGIEYKTIKYDLKIDTDKISFQLVKTLDKLAPFGRANPKPKFLIEDNVRKARLTRTKEHLMFNIGGISSIAFGLADKKDKLKESGKIIGQLGINKYRGRENLQIQAKKIIE